MNYRSDIDGLRAIAVFSVLAFHALPNAFPGGFAGVDIFFVISGFLITRIILNDIENKQFKFSSFYARRIRRIFPALITVLLFCLLAGWLLLFNDEYKQLGNHAMRSTVFLSNFILWKEVGYFDVNAEFKPLLHLWSLAIEEQFYLIWPAFLLLLVKWTRRPIYWVILSFLFSLTWNVYHGFNDPSHAFYSPLTRFWEMMCGALLAFQNRSNCADGVLRKWLGVAGITLIFLSIFSLGSAPFYPGIWAIFPVVGTALYIASNGAHQASQAFLTSRPMIWLGKISYSLYLWHWPLLVFPQIVLGETPPLAIRLSALFLSITLAVISTKYIESWFRYGTHSFIKVILLCLGMFSIGLVGYQINRLQGLENRPIHKDSHVIRSGDIGQEPFYDYIRKNYFECSNQSVRSDSGVWDGFARCYQSSQDISSKILLLGDSHAEHLFPGFAKELPDENITFWGKMGPPLLTNGNYQVIFGQLEKQKEFDHILLSAHWHAYAMKLQKPESLRIDLKNTVEFLQRIGKRVTLIDDVHGFDFTPLRCKVERPLSLITKCDSEIDVHQLQKSSYIPTFEQLISSMPDTHLIRISDLLCNERGCSMQFDNTVRYRDQHNLNVMGSIMISKAAIAQMRHLKIIQTKEFNHEVQR